MKNIMLVGNPNTGKTTLYNKLTSSDEHIGNWHGVTIDAKNKEIVLGGQEVNVIDLPGIYSLTPYNPEECVAVDFLFKNNYKIINICDINNIRQNLYLTLELIEAGYDVSIVVNITDNKNHNETIQKLKSFFKGNVAFINVAKERKIHQKIEKLLCESGPLDINISYGDEIKKFIANLYLESAPFNKHFIGLKLIQKDKHFLKYINIDFDLEKLNVSMDKIAKARYDFIDSLLGNPSSVKTQVNILDTIFLSKVWGVPIFIGILLLVFYITFGPIGNALKDVFSYLIQDLIGGTIYEFLQDNEFNYVLTDFIYKGLICGVGGILSFLPQIVLLFFFLSLLEESGYLSRLAFLFEDILNKIGLSGKSLFTLIMSCGCSTIAMLTARNINDNNIKQKTMMLAPYMCCSAKLPIFIILTSTFFDGNYLLIFAMYLLSIIVTTIVAYILNKKMPMESNTFMLEFPRYRIPSIPKMLKFIYSNSMIFLTKIGSVLLIFSLVFYFLNTYDFNLIHIDLGGVSIMQRICEVIAPIFTPLGFGEWGVVSALVSGIVAKEIIVGTIATINGVGGMDIASSIMDTTSLVHFDTSSALSFMAFALLYIPCLSSISVMIKQLGKKSTCKALCIQFCTAYLVSLLIYWSYRLLDWRIIFIVILFAIICGLILLGHNKSKKCSHCCSHCESCYLKK